MQPDPIIQEMLAKQAAAMRHLSFISFLMFYLALPIMAFFSSLKEGYNKKVEELKQVALQKRREQIPNYSKLPAVERKAQEELWTVEISKELQKDNQAIWICIKHSVLFGIGVAIIIFILEIIFYHVILRLIF